MNKFKNFTFGFIIFAIIIVAIDLIFKSLVIKNLEIGEKIQIIWGLNISRIQNLRMSFGASIDPLIIDIIKMLIQVFFVLIFIRIQLVKINKLMKYSSTLVVFGWIGNYLDSIFFANEVNHYVQLDYINISGLFRFYINLSSIMNSLGWILFIIAILVKSGDLKIVFKKQ